MDEMSEGLVAKTLAADEPQVNRTFAIPASDWPIIVCSRR